LIGLGSSQKGPLLNMTLLVKGVESIDTEKYTGIVSGCFTSSLAGKFSPITPALASAVRHYT